MGHWRWSHLRVHEGFLPTPGKETKHQRFPSPGYAMPSRLRSVQCREVLGSICFNWWWCHSWIWFNRIRNVELTMNSLMQGMWQQSPIVKDQQRCWNSEMQKQKANHLNRGVCLTAWKIFHQMALQLTDGALMSVQTQDVLNVTEAFIVLLSFSVIDLKTFA